MKRRLADCPQCGGKLVSHFDDCPVRAAVGVCSSCEGTKRGSGTKPCEECHGTGLAPAGRRDLAYWLVRSIDAQTREMCR